MIKTKLFILVLTLFLHVPKTFFGQGGGPVTLDGKQFKLNGANFYPMVMNYAVELTMPNNSGANGWPNSYVIPYIEYGVNNGPIGGPGSYIFECTNSSQCEADILTDWNYLSTLNFNAIRVAGFYPKYQHNGGNPNFFFSIRETGSYNWEYLPINLFVPNDPGLNFVLDQYEKVMELADQTGMKLIFNMIGQKSIFMQVPGPDNDEIDYYNKFLEHLAIRVAGSPYAHTVLAYDLWNEPCYFDKSENKTKENTCEIISQWYTTVKTHGSTPLVTIGTCGSGDNWFYDPAVLKVDFHSLHIYPDWRDFEDRTDPLIQQRAISRIFDELYWFNKISPVPWIIGEIGFAASVNLPVSPPQSNQNGAHGTLLDQANFAQLVLDATCNSGGSGFSWWYFQDGWYFKDSPHEAHWGMLERGYATGVTVAEKPIVNTFDSYTLPSAVSSCGPSPVSTASLQTYNPSLTYFNPYQHPANPTKTIKGYIVDQDGNPIANAYVGGHTMTYYHQTNPAKERHPYYRLFTAENGYFEITPEPFDLNSPPHSLLGELHTLFITPSGGERLKYSAFWTPINASTIMPTMNTSHLWTLNRTNYTFDGMFQNINVANGESRDLEAGNSLTISDAMIFPGAIVNISAKQLVYVKSELHARLGSTTHIYCETTNIDCSNYNGYIMEYRMPGSAITNPRSTPQSINLKFTSFGTNLYSFNVFPNPANVSINLSSEVSKEITILLKNIMGQELTSFSFSKESGIIDVSHLAKGVYFLIEEQTGNVQKLIIQ